MSQGKNEAAVLMTALVVTAGLLGAGAWWFLRSGVSISPTVNPSTTGSNPSSEPSPPNSASDAISNPTFASVPNVPSGLFSYGGSSTWAPIRGRVDPLIRAAHPNFQLRYSDPPGATPSSGAGIQMLINNQLAFAQSSRAVTPDEYQQAQQRGFTLREIPVALEGIAIAVHPSLNLPGLSLEQLRGIYTGQITNWSQVGGENRAIVAYSRPADGGTVEFFVSQVLGGQALGSNVQTVSTTTQALREVSNQPGGIYYASAPEVIGQCTTKPLPLSSSGTQFVAPYVEPLVLPSQCPAQRNQVNMAALQSGQYPLTRSLFVIVRQDGQTSQQVGEAYANLLLSQEGQTLMEQEGFVPIR